MSNEDSKVSDRASPPTLTDEQIITERKRSRRSFLAATGVVLGGAMAVVTTGCSDPDRKKPANEPPKPAKSSDPDSEK